MKPTRLAFSGGSFHQHHPVTHDVLASLAGVGLLVLTLVVMAILAILLMDAIYYGWIGRFI
jgi:hypothetical protein